MENEIKNDLVFACVDCRGKGCKECKFTGEVRIEDNSIDQKKPQESQDADELNENFGVTE